jgi:micrococcal nuclease
VKKLLILFPIFLFLVAAAPTLLTGKIVGVSDGDTVILLTAENIQYKIRLQGVDCPEIHQAFGQKAKQFASDLVFQKNVSVNVFGTDRYGRTLGEVVLPGGVSLNKELVKNGFAWHYKKYSNDLELAQLEIEARNAKIGLWTDPSPAPPWEFRGNPKIDNPRFHGDYQSIRTKKILTKKYRR